MFLEARSKISKRIKRRTRIRKIKLEEEDEDEDVNDDENEDEEEEEEEEEEMMEENEEDEEEMEADPDVECEAEIDNTPVKAEPSELENDQSLDSLPRSELDMQEEFLVEPQNEEELPNDIVSVFKI